MAGPWEKYGQPQAAPAMGAPPVIQGPPKLPDPYQVARDQRDDAREDKRDRRDDAKFDREMSSLTEGQAKGTNFYGSALEANQQFDRLFPKNGPDSGLGQWGQKNFPNLTNQISSDQRSAYRQAVENFIRATLRLESGATIGPEEYDLQYRIFFPLEGAGPEEIEAKRRARLAAIEGLRASAGPGAANVKVLPPADDDNAGFEGEELAIWKKLSPEVKAAYQRGEVHVPGLPLTAQVGGQAAPEPPAPPPNGEIGPGLRSFLVGTGDVVEGLANIPGLIANPANAALNMTGIPQAITGEPLGTDLGAAARDALGLPRSRGGLEGIISQGVEAGAGGLGFSGAARAGAQYAAPMVQNALARFASQPLADTASGFVGGASGETARQNGAGPVAQVGASLLGGGVSVPAAVRAERALARPAPVQNALTRAGKAEGVTVNRAMADPSLNNRITGVESTQFGGKVLQREMGRIGRQIEGGVKRLGREGEAMEPSVAGDRIRSAAERSIKNSGKRSNALYRRAEQMAGDAKLEAPIASQQIDEMIGRLSETANTNSREIAYLESLKQDLSKPISVGALRDLRTTLRKQISRGELVFGQNERRVLEIMDAVSQDISNGLTAQGKGRAAQAFKTADDDYRARMEFIQGTVQKVIGKRDANLSPEEVFRRFQSMTSPKGDQAGFARMMRTLEPDEQADIAATFAEALGKNRAGDFTTAQLVSQAEKLPRAARVNLFGAEGAKSLDNLITLAKEHKRVVGQFNGSRTAVGNDYRSWLSSVLFGGGSGIGAGVLTGDISTGAITAAAAGTVAGSVKHGRDILNARALMSPDISKWLASAPRTTSAKAIDAHFARLGTIASRNPGLQAEIQQLQQAIMRVANENVGGVSRSVAGDKERNDQDKR